jgi:hypothetical protein
MIGGYALVDCNGLNLLAQSSQTKTGLFALCEKAVNSGKPIYAVNCVYGTGVKMTPISVMAIKQGDEYCFSASILQIWVKNDDTVRIVSLLA